MKTLMRASALATATAEGRLVHLVAGTRPEAIKIAPIVAELPRHGLVPVLVDSGQQPGRVAEALAPFGLSPDVELKIARRDGSLVELMGLIAAAYDARLASERPAAVLVQGDTTTALAAGLVAHLRRIDLVHLEAGLRTHDRDNPFPEETNRRLIADLADVHLAPTDCAAAALVAEGHSRDRIVVTGNTVVDALLQLLPNARLRAESSQLRREAAGADGQHLVVTVHRREAWGAGVRAVAHTVADLLASHPRLHASVVTHPNPDVARDVVSVLQGVERCRLLPPQPYDDMLALLTTADVVLTDSGGIQEEAPTIGVPVVVARYATERPEGVAAGWAELAGLEPGRLNAAVSRALRSTQTGGAVRALGANPYGDGHAAARAGAALNWLVNDGPRPGDWLAPHEADYRRAGSAAVASS